MLKRFAAPVLALSVCGLSATAAQAVKLPEIAAAPANAAPACVTPGRMMAMIRDRNPSLAPKFADIALHYMRIGQELGVRWDYAFYQMLVETGFLTYRGDVKPHQNNFAGIAATGGGVPGESFPSVAAGVRAHIEHLMVYAGLQVDNPVAERTRKIQSWGIMEEWRTTFSGPVTFDRMTRKWSPGDRGYAGDIKAVSDRFMSNWCNRADPAPEMMAGIRTVDPNKATAKTPGYTTVAVNNTGALPASGAGLGAPATTSLPNRNPRASITTPSVSGTAASQVTVVNGNASATKTATRTETTVTRDNSVGRFANNITAFASPPPAKSIAPKSCRVWTASYGGQKAMIIRSIGGGHVNYTVLDVNAGREKAEADAYIAAYAKGGEPVERFEDPQKALKQAFQLCPNKKAS
jgi:hypothetical protein